MTRNDFTKIYSEHIYAKFSDTIPQDSVTEECGVFGVYSPKPIDTFSLAQFGMFALQHRGQEAAGLSVLKDGAINTHKLPGLVLDMFKSIEEPADFQGNAAIGHSRYTTAGGGSRKNIQPLFAINQYGNTQLSIVHNGNITGLNSLREELKSEGLPFLASSDTEVVLRSIQRNLNLPLHQAIQKGVKDLKGAFSILILSNDSLAAFRDPKGIRPLCMGKLPDDSIVFCSESCGLDAVGAKYVRDVEPGELIILNEEGLKSYRLTDEPADSKICAFEYIYFSRPDTIMENIDVYDLRVKSGEILYQQSPVEADVVIGVPDSGIPAAIGYSKASGIPFEPILVKNRYMSRSFIIPSQEMRERVVHLKLNPIIPKIQGKRVVILDDSIVRGTTSKILIKILKDAGASEIHFRSASPPIVSPCFLGINMPTRKELISAQMDIPTLRDYLQVDSLDFLQVDSLISLLGSNNHCLGCFTGKYPIENQDE